MTGGSVSSARPFGAGTVVPCVPFLRLRLACDCAGRRVERSHGNIVICCIIIYFIFFIVINIFIIIINPSPGAMQILIFSAALLRPMLPRIEGHRRREGTFLARPCHRGGRLRSMTFREALPVELRSACSRGRQPPRHQGISSDGRIDHCVFSILHLLYPHAHNYTTTAPPHSRSRLSSDTKSLITSRAWSDGVGRRRHAKVEMVGPGAPCQNVGAARLRSCSADQ
ncbi:hypothetical protein GGR56DRAFT_645488 [Xylariaceae sp. FL0804]|nr:hypothetical protein GGR56DRAFT_645488 [Xylariaceae sp. FL0804]